MSSQAFQIHIGTYDGALMGFQGNLKSLENIYSFVSSSGSLRVLLILGKFLFAGGYDEIIRVYNLNKMKEDGLLEGHEGSISAMKGHKNFLFTGGDDGKILIWKTKDWALLHKLDAHSKAIYDLDIHSSGKIMISIGKDQKLIVWNLLNFKKTFTRNFSYDVFKVKFSQNEEVILLMGEKKIHLLKIETNKMLKVLEHEQKIHDFICYQDKYLIVGDEMGCIYIWDLSENKENKETEGDKPAFSFIKFKAHEKRVKQIKILKNESVDLLITCSSDGMIKIWDILYLLGENQKIAGVQDLGEKVESVYKIDSRQRINCLEVNEKNLQTEENLQQQETIIKKEKKAGKSLNPKLQKKKNKKKIQTKIKNSKIPSEKQGAKKKIKKNKA